MTKIIISLAGGIGIVLASIPGASAKTFDYVCDDQSKLAVTFHSSPASAEIVFQSTKEALSLPQVPSADGGRYAAGDVEFWIKGRQATLTRGKSATVCTQ